MILIKDIRLEGFLEDYFKKLKIFQGTLDFSQDFQKNLALEIRGSVLFKTHYKKLLQTDFEIFKKEKKFLFIHPFKVSLLELIKEVRRIYPSAFPNNFLKIDTKLNVIVANVGRFFKWGLFYSYNLKGFETFSPLYVAVFGFLG